jgi:hypothetical protein
MIWILICAFFFLYSYCDRQCRKGWVLAVVFFLFIHVHIHTRAHTRACTLQVSYAFNSEVQVMSLEWKIFTVFFSFVLLLLYWRIILSYFKSWLWKWVLVTESLHLDLWNSHLCHNAVIGLLRNIPYGRKTASWNRLKHLFLQSMYRVFRKRYVIVERLTIEKGLLHLNSVWKQITAVSWHCHQGWHVLVWLLSSDTPNTVMFAMLIGNYMQLKLGIFLERLFIWYFVSWALSVFHPHKKNKCSSNTFFMCPNVVMKTHIIMELTVLRFAQQPVTMECEEHCCEVTWIRHWMMRISVIKFYSMRVFINDGTVNKNVWHLVTRQSPPLHLQSWFFLSWSGMGVLSTQAWMPAYSSILRSPRQYPRSLQKFLLSLSGLAGAWWVLGELSSSNTGGLSTE